MKAKKRMISTPSLSLQDRSGLPDVSGTVPSARYLPLQQVGMAGIETLVRIIEQGEERVMPAQVDMFVDLTDQRTRGIHMSRMYKIIYRELPNKRLTPLLLRKVMRDCLVSQQGVSTSARIRLEFTFPLLCPSLLSGHHGYRHYPIIWEGAFSEKENFLFFHRFKLLYSSTCPCSTALSEALQCKTGGFTGFAATPHAQRSEADITLCFRRPPTGSFIVDKIKKLEKAIKTPVQTAVKREDEQEFARLNAENQMFCEDAARILKQALEKESGISDYRIRVAHFESLHAHDAVAVAVKGIPGGLGGGLWVGG